MSDDEEKRFYQFFSRFWLILFVIFCALFCTSMCTNIYFTEKSANIGIDICTDKTTKKLDIECLSAIKKIYE